MNFYLEAHAEDEILILIGQLFNAKHLLHRIGQQHKNFLLLLFRSCGYRYAQWVMSVQVQADGNLADINDASMLECTGLLLTQRDCDVLGATERRH